MITKKELIKILLIFLSSRILLILFLILSKDLNIYDSIHYINIAQYGYNENLIYAFFPLYPLTIKALHIIIPSYYISGIILSNLFSLLATFVLYLLIDKEKYKIIAITLFLFSPILGYTTIIYTESLYLLLTLIAFYFYKKNKLLLCSISVGLAMLTRNSGIVLLGALGLELLIKLYKKEIKIKHLLLFTIPALLIGSLFPIYLYMKTGNPLMYISVQTTEWNRISSNTATIFIRDIQYLIKNKHVLYIFIQNWLFFGIALIYSIKYIKQEFVISVYTIVTLILFTITCRNSSWNTLPTIGLFRYVFSLFPVYLYPFIKENKHHYFPYIPLIIISIANTIFIYIGAFIA